MHTPHLIDPAYEQAFCVDRRECKEGTVMEDDNVSNRYYVTE